jgi:transglutaminase-like putative cysteine protease
MSEIKNVKSINMTLNVLYGCLIIFFINHLAVGFVSVLALLCVWNTYITIKHKPKPSSWFANSLAALSLLLMFYTVGFSDTVSLFVAMLLLSSLFKLLQAKTKQHYHAITTLSFFSLSAVYLFDQGVITTLVVSSLFILNFAILGLIEANHNLKIATKQSGKLLISALPIAVFLLLFLPKMPAFWQLPGPKLAKTGLSETVDPFDIAKLSNSDELVFRAQFTKRLEQSPLYWRAIIHDEFNGKAWQTSHYSKFNLSQQNKSNSLTNEIAQYSIIAEPSTSQWLFGLDYANSHTASIDNLKQGVLRKQKREANSVRYDVTSYRLANRPLSNRESKFNRFLKNETNPQTIKLANNIKANTTTDRDFYNTLLNYYKVNNFSYTLNPTPMLGTNTIDQFLFEQQRGFCGHYASAAAYIFRSAGIPARVVSGYLGGEFNASSGYYSIRQYEAHAWVEVYLKNEGWQIFDATSVVAPERLNGSLSQNTQLNNEFKTNLDFGLVSLSNFAAINWFRLELENLDYKWSSWVLGFDQHKQTDFLKQLFGNKFLWLVPFTVLIVLTLCFASYFIYLNLPRRADTPPPMVKEFNSIIIWANKNGIKIPMHMSPIQKINYIAVQAPHVAHHLNNFITLFSQVRYAKKAFTLEHKKQAKNLINLIKNTKKRKL